MSSGRRSGLRDFLRQLLILQESPRRTALAFGIGVCLAFSPLWGLHTILGLAVAFLFRLNRLAVLAGVWVNTPWTMAPAASLGTAIGFWVLGVEVHLPTLSDESVLSSQFWGEMAHLLWPFLVGNTIFSIFAGFIGYYVLRWILVKNARRASVQ